MLNLFFNILKKLNACKDLCHQLTRRRANNGMELSSFGGFGINALEKTETHAVQGLTFLNQYASFMPVFFHNGNDRNMQ